MSPPLIILRIAVIMLIVEGLIIVVQPALPPAFHALAARTGWVSAAVDAIALLLISGPIVYFWVIRPYISARSLAESVLRESENRLNKAQRIANIGSWELDLRNGVLTWSDEIYRMFEIDPALFGASYEAFLDGIHPEDREMVDKAYTDSLTNRTPYEIAHRLRMPDGRIKWVQESCETDFDADGKPLVSRGTVQDITEHQQAQQEILRLNETLEQRVEARTRELAMANSRLRNELTARKEAEEAVSAAETRYRNVIENAVEGIFQSTPEGRFISANPAFARMLGYDSPEDLLDSVTDIATQVYADPQRRDEIRPPIESSGEMTAVESRFRRKDGTVAWLSETARTVRDQNGKLLRYECFMQDVTVRKHAETALRESEQLLRLAIESASFGTWIRNIPDDRVIWDKRTEEIFGLEPGTFEGTMDAVLSRVHPDDREKTRTSHQNLMEHGQGYECEYRVIWPDGSIHHIASTASLIRNDTDSVSRAIGMLHDITDRKRAEMALRESEERFRAVVDNVPIAVYLKDLEGRYLLHNKVYEDWYGIASDEILGRTIDEFFPAEMAGAFIAQDKRLLESGAIDSMEIDVLHRDGSVRPTIMIKFPVPAPDGTIAAIGGINIDITERKRAEAALQAAQGELLRKERLAALGELTGTVAHELRNPLGAVAASAYVLQRKCAGQDADVEKALGLVDRGIKRCDNIITELLDFARAKGLQPVPTNLDDWLSALLAEQQPPAGVTLRRDLESDDAVACFDPEEMRRAVINVVDNACQAVASGQGDDSSGAMGEVTVGTRATAQRVEIDITDSGPGIPEGSLERVLEPLYSTKPFGTGLGLPTVHRIMEEHGGGLEIDSKEGQGTRVTLWLQRQPDTAEPLKA